jgi:hypothetical protein
MVKRSETRGAEKSGGITTQSKNVTGQEGRYHGLGLGTVSISRIPQIDVGIQVGQRLTPKVFGSSRKYRYNHTFVKVYWKVIIVKE